MLFRSTFVLEPALPGFAPYREAFRVLFNSYCVAVGPRHRVFVGEFEIAERLATNAEYQAFVADGGYRRPEL